MTQRALQHFEDIKVKFTNDNLNYVSMIVGRSLTILEGLNSPPLSISSYTFDV